MSFKIGRSAIWLSLLIGVIVLVGWTPFLDRISSRAASYFIQQPITLSGVRFSYLNGFAFGRVDILSPDGKGLVTGGPGTLFFIPASSLKAKIRIEASNIFANYEWCTEYFPWVKSLWTAQKTEAMGPSKVAVELLCGTSGVEMIRIRSFELKGILIQGGILFKNKIPLKGNLSLHLNPGALERVPKQFTQWLEKNRMPNGNYKISWTQTHLTVRDKTGPRLEANWQSQS
jgi:hypothetical protein